MKKYILLVLFATLSPILAKAQVPFDDQVYEQDSGNFQFSYYFHHSATLDQIEMWDGINHTRLAASFSDNDFWFDGTTIALGIERTLLQTNTSGVVTWTFPVPFPTSGGEPVIQVTVKSPTAGSIWSNSYIINSSGGNYVSVTVTLVRTASNFISLLGINLLQVTGTPQAYVGISAQLPP